LTNDFVELERKRENSFCCGAGGAQFWKEEEAGEERISDNRYREAEGRLEGRGENKVLAVGCPFCKSMLESTPGKGEASGIAVKDVAELMLESVLRRAGESVVARAAETTGGVAAVEAPEVVVKVVEPKVEAVATVATQPVEAPAVVRKKWAPKAGAASVAEAAVEPSAPVVEAEPSAAVVAEPTASAPARKKWEPKKSVKPPESEG
jgi:hypothetical protein